MVHALPATRLPLLHWFTTAAYSAYHARATCRRRCRTPPATLHLSAATPRGFGSRLLPTGCNAHTLHTLHTLHTHTHTHTPAHIHAACRTTTLVLVPLHTHHTLRSTHAHRTSHCTGSVPTCLYTRLRFYATHTPRFHTAHTHTTCLPTYYTVACARFLCRCTVGSWFHPVAVTHTVTHTVLPLRFHLVRSAHTTLVTAFYLHVTVLPYTRGSPLPPRTTHFLLQFTLTLPFWFAWHAVHTHTFGYPGSYYTLFRYTHHTTLRAVTAGYAYTPLALVRVLVAVWLVYTVLPAPLPRLHTGYAFTRTFGWFTLSRLVYLAPVYTTFCLRFPSHVPFTVWFTVATVRSRLPLYTHWLHRAVPFGFLPHIWFWFGWIPARSRLVTVGCFTGLRFGYRSTHYYGSVAVWLPAFPAVTTVAHGFTFYARGCCILHHVYGCRLLVLGYYVRHLLRFTTTRLHVYRLYAGFSRRLYIWLVTFYTFALHYTVAFTVTHTFALLDCRVYTFTDLLHTVFLVARLPRLLRLPGSLPPVTFGYRFRSFYTDFTHTPAFTVAALRFSFTFLHATFHSYTPFVHTARWLPGYTVPCVARFTPRSRLLHWFTVRYCVGLRLRFARAVYGLPLVTPVCGWLHVYRYVGLRLRVTTTTPRCTLDCVLRLLRLVHTVGFHRTAVTLDSAAVCAPACTGFTVWFTLWFCRTHVLVTRYAPLRCCAHRFGWLRFLDYTLHWFSSLVPAVGFYVCWFTHPSTAYGCLQFAHYAFCRTLLHSSTFTFGSHTPYGSHGSGSPRVLLPG